MPHIVRAGFLSGGKIEYGLIPLGAIGLTAFCAWLSLPGLTFSSFAAGLALLGLASLINLWNPQRIVLGGGVIDRIDLLFTVASSEAMQAALPIAAEAVDIVRAELGDNSGMIGAALL